MTGRLWRGGMVFCGLMILWGLASRSGIPHFLLPSPMAVAEALWVNRAYLGWNTLITLSEILSGLALGVTLLAPLLVLWLGFGMSAKVAMAVLVIFFPVTSAFFDGLRRVNQEYLDLARSMNASFGAQLRHVRLMAALPALGSGLRMAAAVAPIGAIIGEWVGSAEGLGYVMLNANARLQTDICFAALFILVLLTLLLWLAVDTLLHRLIPPSDPALPPRMVAARQADLAITYQPQVHFFADEGLPLVRVGTLINSPLNTVIALNKQIKTPADLQGKKVGYSVSGIEQATLSTMAQHAGIDPASIKLVNVNFQLTSALLAGQVDAVIGGYRNIEAQELKLQGKTPVVMNVEDYGVPAYDELVIVAHRDAIHEAKIRKFLTALQAGVSYLRAHPQESWEAFAAAHPELKTELNHQAWLQTVPLFATDPAALDKPRYEAYEQFLYNNKLVKKVTPLTNYAVELH